MITTHRITRRRFLKHLTVLATSMAGLIPNPVLAQQAQKSDLHNLALNIINASFHNSKAVSPLGEAYLYLYPDEKNLTHLLNRIFDENPTLLDIARKNHKNSLMNALRHITTADFENGDTVNIDGWVLAKTEARISALTKLI